MMRKTNSLLTTALAALLLTGCAQNELTEISPDAAPAVGFKVYTTAQTKGLVTDNAASGSSITKSIKSTGFGVIAYYTNGNNWSTTTPCTPNFMWNQKVTHSGSVWSYTPQKYWPNTEGDKISFFAYAPYSATQTPGSESLGITVPAKASAANPTLTFELQTTATNMVDLVATKNLNVTKQTGDVKFQFQHLLTRVSFKARHDLTVANNVTGVYVTAMRLLGTSAQGSAAANTSSLFYSKATYDWNAGKWVDTGATKQANAYPINVLNTATANAGGYNKSSVKLAYQGANAAATNLFKTNQYLFLIPPTDDANATNGGIKSEKDVRVQIDYDIVTVDGNLSTGHSISSTTATVSLPNSTLQRGKAYEFTFTIGLNPVTVTAEVTLWGAAEEVYIPRATATAANDDAIKTALSTLNKAKAVNPHCDYFVINVTGAPNTTVSLSAITDDKFVIGDKIELIHSTNPTGTYLLANWTAVKKGTSITLTKDK